MRRMNTCGYSLIKKGRQCFNALAIGYGSGDWFHEEWNIAYTDLPVEAGPHPPVTPPPVTGPNSPNTPTVIPPPDSSPHKTPR